jgi:hypothetical protein
MEMPSTSAALAISLVISISSRDIITRRLGIAGRMVVHEATARLTTLISLDF